MKSMRLKKRLFGFTLIEMLITVALIALLTSISFPLISISVKRTQERELRESLWQIRTAIDRYKQAVDDGRILEDAKGSGYPPNLSVLVSGVVDAKSPNKSQMIYFLRNLPNDPFLPIPASSTDSPWGLRSYLSSAENPQPGQDVFDVYSLASGLGLNKIPYKSW